jgi:hypothetical protein
VNVPLQQRGSALDLDTNRINVPMVSQYEETKLTITNALNVYLNIEQSLIINTSSIIISLQKIRINTIPNKTIQMNDNAQIRFPSKINFNFSQDSSVLLECVLTPLAIVGHNGQGNTNLSTLLSIRFFDENSNEIPVHTSTDQAIELLIPRDVNTVVPKGVTTLRDFNTPILQMKLRYSK